MRPTLALALLLLVAGVPALAQEHPVSNTKIVPPQAPKLIELLKAGGLIVFFRHGTTPDYAEPPGHAGGQLVPARRQRPHQLLRPKRQVVPSFGEDGAGRHAEPALLGLDVTRRRKPVQDPA